VSTIAARQAVGIVYASFSSFSLKIFYDAARKFLRLAESDKTATHTATVGPPAGQSNEAM
jgi:hypothetical protein